ncbi:MAG: hypothetical protein QOE70_5841 [Chthoniobacter sp.]|nr:hypothetical protein [Chthoniobacter sp.]
MTKTTKYRDTLRFLFLAVFWIASAMAPAAPVTVLAPVVEVQGSATWAGGGSTKSGKLQVGESLAEGSAIQTGADSRVLFSPVPGIAVSEAKDTSASLLRLAVTKNDGAVQRRDAVLRLAIGTLSFSLEKRDASTTTFAVETPSGTMKTRGSVGTITVVPPCVKVASLSGKVVFTPKVGTLSQTTRDTESTNASVLLSTDSPATASGVPIVIPPGCFLTVCGKGDSVEIHLINTIERTLTNLTANGTAIGTRVATAQELESTRGFFEAALAHGSLAVGYGLLSAEGAAEITQTLTMINQSFAAVGLAPIETPAIGSSTRRDSSNSESAPPSAGFSGGSLNPANTSGEVISRER